MGQSQTQRNSGTRTRFKEPPRYRVIMHNDDFTTMDFVVMLLMEVFFKSEQEATGLMLAIHQTGNAVVGIYPKDIAQSKTQKASALASTEGFPLKVTCEPE